MAQNIYDDEEFFAGYSRLPRSVEGLDGAPEWPALRALLPDIRGRRVLDLGCGFGWASRLAHGAPAGDAARPGFCEVEQVGLGRLACGFGHVLGPDGQANRSATTMPRQWPQCDGDGSGAGTAKAVSGWLTIGPHDQVKGKNTQPGRVIWNIETPDVPGDFERFKAAGATVIREPYHPGEETEMWIATFADPDDNYFQLGSPM